MTFKMTAAAAATAIFGCALIGAVPAAAQTPSVIKLVMDENGNGASYADGVFTSNFTGTVITDPGPGGLLNALTYTPYGPFDIVAGDLVVLLPPTFGLDDVIRFNPQGSGGPGSSASIVFYSNPVDGIDSLA